MTQQVWSAVDEFITDQVVAQDSALEAALSASDESGLPAIAVTPAHGKLLHLLALTVGARRVLEIGTLGGYSTIWLARALPADGRLVTLEFNDRHAKVARENLARAGVADLVQVRVGAALDLLPELVDEPAFDLVFIDADKVNNPEYFRWAARLTRPGSLIIVDNVVRGGAVADPGSTDPAVLGTRLLFEVAGSMPEVTVTAVQTVGGKGYDGLLIARVN